MTGASTQKLLTATGLLLALGPDATIRTEAVAAAAPEGGVVAGRPVRRGRRSGRPRDARLADAQPRHPARAVHDIDGLVAAIAAGASPASRAVWSATAAATTTSATTPTLARRLIDQDQVGPIGGLMVNDGFAEFSTARTNADACRPTTPRPTPRVLTERLEARGIAVGGRRGLGAAPEGAAVVASLDSPPLAQIVAEMLTTSDNETAEAALKEIGVAASGEGSWAAGAAGLTELLAEAGVPVDGVQVADGSGLTIENRFTCRTLVDVLGLPETGPVVRDGLAVAGETGTLAERCAGTESPAGCGPRPARCAT